MFTGIVEEIGEVKSIRRLGAEAVCILRIPASFSDSRPGESIAVDGVCLTITEINGDLFTLDLSAETLSKSTLANVTQGTRVNLERALRLSDRLGGHLVSGHVDGMGIIEMIERLQRSWIIHIGVDQSLSRYLIDKGSVAVDGISLTVNHCRGNSFDVAVIPQTAEKTTLFSKKIADRVNIEIDQIAKYIEKCFLHERTTISKEKPSGIDKDMLIRYGFGERNGHF
ncbi:MAG: riboflavin synthase [Thermodesulfobacteriota bacterium]